MRKLIELNNVQAGYDGKIVLEDINLCIKENDYIGVIGPNGGGKTTLIKIILGLIKPTKGDIITHNNGIESFCGYLPQYNNFDKEFPISVMEVVLSGLMSKKKFFNKYSSEDKKNAIELLEMAGIQDLARKNIGKISGGQMQRALLCRAIISNPSLLILDEPVTYVDRDFENEMYDLLKELNKKMAIVMVSHDVGIISSHVKTIACVNRNIHYHESNILTKDSLENYNCPIDLITHGILPHRVLQDHNNKK
jgi:zinc transport system ATP-binding protein